MRKFAEFTVRIPLTGDIDRDAARDFVEERIKGTDGSLKKRHPLYEMAQRAKVLRPYRKRNEADA